MDTKKFFLKYISIIITVVPLIIIIFYTISIWRVLEVKHQEYEQKEIARYEKQLKLQHRAFFEEKVKYIDSFIKFLSKNRDNQSIEEKILLFIDSLKKYDNGFIFVFKKDGTVLKHPCAKRLIELVSNIPNKNDKNLLYKFLISAEFNNFVHYKGTDCITNKLVKKIAFVHHIKGTDIYVVISKNEKDIEKSINKKKMILEKKLNDELINTLRLSFGFGLIFIFLSMIFSKFLNGLIKDYEKEIRKRNEIMFSQSRLAQAGELLSMISHQWRQPISKIASISSNIRFKILMGEELSKEYIDKSCEEIEDYTEFLSQTIDDFKEFYKPKKDKEKSYIIPIIKKSISILDSEIRKKSINIVEDYDKDKKLCIYSNELMQVVINIIQNAIDFSKKGAKIEIKTYLKSKEYIITIEDEAGGIKEEYINKIFDAHFSTKDSSKSKNLGLGLYVSKVIIEQHFKGKLEVSSYDNKSKFTIRLLL